MVETMSDYEMSDPSNEGTKLGPMQGVHARDERRLLVALFIREALIPF